MKTKKVLTFLLVFSVILTVFIIPVSAATRGSNKSTAIYVTTKANWLKPGSESITLSPIKGEARNGEKFYGYYSVSVYRYSTGTTKYYKLNNKSVKIPLARNASYKITVMPTGTYDVACETRIAVGGRLKSYPSWYVSKTNKVSSIS